MRSVAALVGLVMACGARGQEGSVVDAASLAPADADFVMVVDDAAASRSATLGVAVREVMRAQGAELGGAGMFGQTRAAWRALAERLGEDPDEAFDGLLGSRVVLVTRGEAGGEPSWAVASWVGRAQGDRVRKSLDAALRGDVAGFPRFALEDGLYQMVLVPGDERSVLVLWPKGAGELGRLMALRIGGRDGGEQGERLGSVRALELVELFGMQGADLGGEPGFLVIGRRGAGEPGDLIDAGDWLAGVAAVNADGTAFRFAVLDADLAMRGRLGAIRAWSLGKFAELAKGSIGAAMVHSAALEAEAASPLVELGRSVGAFAEEMGIEQRKIAGAIYPGEDGSLDFVVAVEAGGGRDLAGPLDGWMTSRLEGLFQKVNFDQPAAAKRGGVRVVDLPAGLPGLATRGGQIAWMALTSKRAPEAAEPAPVWCVAGVGSGEVVEQVASVLCAEHIDMELQPWVEVADFRPREIAERIRSMGVTAPMLLRLTDRASWRTYARADLGLIVGRGEVELAQ